tara:strand:+ start:181 stop:942 length:762 start_codon:yes stop_codon:yes gene_type:complete
VKSLPLFLGGAMGKAINQTTLLRELDIAVKKLNNKNLKSRYTTKKNILRMLSKKRFKKLYDYNWWHEFRDEKLRSLTKGGKFTCPCCGQYSDHPTLQHSWHPTPFRVLATRKIDDQAFRSMIPDYIEHQKAEKKAFTDEEYKRTIYYITKTYARYTEQEIYKYGRTKASSNYALVYFTDDDLLIEHINEIKRHIKMSPADWDFVCGSCAKQQDSHIIATGRLYPDEPYFLIDENCTRRELLSDACIKEYIGQT